jgi:hypothetical protein
MHRRHLPLYPDVVNFVAAVMLTGICYWLVYRNLVINQTTARIASLTIAGILSYFIVINIVIGVLIWVIIETVAAAGLSLFLPSCSV